MFYTHMELSLKKSQMYIYFESCKTSTKLHQLLLTEPKYSKLLYHLVFLMETKQKYPN